jgi:nitrile hydratase accessory protein
VTARIDAHEPTFAAPWEARAFAMAVRLRDQGHLRWPAFQACLAARIAADPDQETGYYEHWLACLEALIAPTTP